MKTKLYLLSTTLLISVFINSCFESNSSSTSPLNPTPPVQTTEIPADGILYVGDSFIYVMDTDGSNPRQLSLSKEYFKEDYPSSSADGRKVVFRRYGKGIIVMDNSGEKIVTDDSKSPDYTTWSYDGKIYFTGYSSAEGKEYVYSMNSDGTGEKQISPVYNSVATPSDDHPSVSPDNSSVIFSTNRSGNGGAILKVDLTTGAAVYLSDTSTMVNTPDDLINPAEQPTWSPDGKKIAFAAYPGYPDYSAKERIYLMNADGSEKVQLTSDTEANCSWPSWSPDGSKIVFQKAWPGFSHTMEIWVMNADGNGGHALTDRTKTGYEQHPCFIGKPR